MQKIKQTLDIQAMPTATKLADYIEDTIAKAEANHASYGAVIVFDLRKRAINREKPFICSVAGDDLPHALAEFREEDESDGLLDSDFTPEIITVLYQATF